MLVKVEGRSKCAHLFFKALHYATLSEFFKPKALPQFLAGTKRFPSIDGHFRFFRHYATYRSKLYIFGFLRFSVKENFFPES